jgi:CRISPR system Cascade subunit CasA
MSPTMAAIGIYTRQSFAPSWGTGYRVGQRGGGPLSTVVVPDNATLFQVILANLPILSAQTIYNLKNDIPKILPWLAPTIQSAGNQIPSLSQVDELQTFFATPNRIRLDFKSISSRCVISGELCDYGVVSFTKENYGVNYSSLPYRHPMTPYYQSVGKTPTTLPVHPSLDKIGWQNYKGWIYCNDASNNILTYRELAENNTVRVRARGYDVTNAKVNGFVDHEVPLHCFNNAQDRTTFDTIVNALIEATSVAGSYLRMTLRNCHSTTTYDAENAFWEETKPFFFDILNQLWAEIASGQTPTLVGNSWSSSIRKVSYSLLDQHTPFDVMNLNTKTACKIAEQRRFFGAFFAGKSKQGKQFQALLTGI